MIKILSVNTYFMKLWLSFYGPLCIFSGTKLPLTDNPSTVVLREVSSIIYKRFHLASALNDSGVGRVFTVMCHDFHYSAVCQSKTVARNRRGGKM